MKAIDEMVREASRAIDEMHFNIESQRLKTMGRHYAIGFLKFRNCLDGCEGCTISNVFGECDLCQIAREVIENDSH